MTLASHSRSKVFISYSHADKRHLDQLLLHLTPLIRDKRVDVWVDTMLKAGDDWRKEIQQALASARVAIVLVSAAFRASKFIAENELPPLLAAAKNDGVLILPVVVGACDFHDSELAHVQAVNNPSQPLSMIAKPRRDEVWVKVVRRVNDALPARPVQQEAGDKLGGGASIAPASSPAQVPVSTALHDGIEANRTGRYDATVQLLRPLANADPHNFVAWFEYAFALAKLGLTDDAVAAFARAYNSSDPRQRILGYNDVKFPPHHFEYAVIASSGAPSEQDLTQPFPPLPFAPGSIFWLNETTQRRVFSRAEWDSGAMGRLLSGLVVSGHERWICVVSRPSATNEFVPMA